MAKAENILTVKELQSLRPQDKGTTLRDGGSLIGIVGSNRNGNTTVTFSYRYRSGDKIREKRIGTWPASTLAEIRAERNTLRALVGSGVDPIEKEHRDKKEAEQHAAQVTLEQLRSAARR